ncbi:WD domain protein [Agyrium rufum]|nr:WD domain protein [Agyrium rufum]
MARVSKRRRIDNDSSMARYSSPDELAANSDYETSFVRRSGNNSRRESANIHQQRAYSDLDSQDSQDELDPTPHTFYRASKGRGLTDSPRTTPSQNDSQDVSPEPLPAESSSVTPIREESAYVGYKEKMVLRGHRKGVAAVRFSPDGQFIASCSADATIRIWDTATGKTTNVLEGHLAGISTIAWSPDSRTLASGSDDKSIRLWNTATGKPYSHLFLGHHNYIYSIAFSPKGNMLVSGSYDEAVFLWDVRTARIMRSLPAHSDPVGGVDFVRDGTLIVSCGGDGLIRIWDTSTGQCLRTLVHEDNAPVSSVRFSPNGKFVLAWTLDSSVRLWNYVEGRCVKTYLGHKNQKYSLSGAFGVYGDSDKAFAVSGSETGEIFIWDVVSKAVLQRTEGHEGVVLGVDTSPQPGLMASGGIDRTVRVWEVFKEDEVVPKIEDTS